MYDIYYAHHQWKYGTQVEQYELDLIRRYFPNAKIFNPSVDLIHIKEDGEEAIMEECLKTVRNSNYLIFSSMDGTIGKGVYQEVKEAERRGKTIFYIFRDTLNPGYKVHERLDSWWMTDRTFAFVSC